MLDPDPKIVEANHLVDQAIQSTDVSSSNTMLEQAATLYEKAGASNDASDARDLIKEE